MQGKFSSYFPFDLHFVTIITEKCSKYSNSLMPSYVSCKQTSKQGLIKNQDVQVFSLLVEKWANVAGRRQIMVDVIGVINVNSRLFIKLKTKKTKLTNSRKKTLICK